MSDVAVGVDLGTTYSSAAVSDPSGRSARVVQLSSTSVSVPSVVSVIDGTVLAGEAAERRLVSDPGATAREFKRRLGDATPLVLGGEAYGAEQLSGWLLSDLLQRVERSEGVAPTVVGLAHPASWGPFRLDLLRDAARVAGVEDVVLVPEPVAAAVANRSRVADGSLVAVFDLGGGTFDAAMVRIGSSAGSIADVQVVGTPEGVERLGGIDFDQAVMAHVDAATGGQVFSLDTSESDARSSLMRLRAECQAAKEHLSTDSEVDIAVSLPSLQTSVRLTRAEFEAMVTPRLADSLSVIDRVAASAGAGWDDVDAVLLVGGSSNIPVVAQIVGQHTGRPVLTATNPHLAIAMGTAIVAAATTAPVEPVAPVAPAPPVEPSSPPPVSAASAVAAGAAGPPQASRSGPPTMPPDGPPTSPPEEWPSEVAKKEAAEQRASSGGSKRSLAIVGGVVAAVVAVVLGLVVFGGGDDDGADSSATTIDESEPAIDDADEPGAPDDEPSATAGEASAETDAAESSPSDSDDPGESAGSEPVEAAADPDGELPTFISDFERVCTTGVGFAGATPYSESPGPNPVVVFRETDSGSLVSTSLFGLPEGWLVEADDDFEDNSELAVTELIACATVATRSPTGIECPLEADDGTTVSLQLVDATYDLRVLEAVTGELVGEGTLEASSTRCPTFVFISDGQTEYLNTPDADAFTIALQPFVAP